MSDKTAQSAVDEEKAIGKSRSSGGSRAEKEHDRAAQEYSRAQATGQLSMRVKIYSPFHDYFDGQAFSVSAENDTGPFDILPKHHNFISLLRSCDLVVRTTSEGEKKIIISGGIMHVKADQVIVFLDV